GGDRSERGQQHDDHSDDAGACGGSGECGGDQQRWAERDADAGLHVYDAGESGADGEFDLAGVGDDGGGYARDDHGHGVPGGSGGELGRDGGNGGERGQQHDHHSDDAGACGGSGECGGDQQRWTERDAEQRIYVHVEQRGRDRVRAIEFGTEHDPGVEHDGGGELCGGADGGGSEPGGGGMGRYQFDDQRGDGQPGEWEQSGGRAGERDGGEAVDLLRQEYRGGKHDGDGDVQQGGGVSGRADSGVQRAGRERAAGSGGGSGGHRNDGEQWNGEHDGGEGTDLRGGHEWLLFYGRRGRVHLANDQSVRQHRGGQDGGQHGQLQR